MAIGFPDLRLFAVLYAYKINNFKNLQKIEFRFPLPEFLFYFFNSCMFYFCLLFPIFFLVEIYRGHHVLSYEISFLKNPNIFARKKTKLNKIMSQKNFFLWKIPCFEFFWFFFSQIRSISDEISFIIGWELSENFYIV